MLASFDIGTMMSQENQIKNVPIDMLKTYHNHKFQLYTGERLDDMVESVKENGILLPIIIQPLADGSYEILSGHNRTNAAKIAGLETVPAIIKENLTEDEAEMYVIETNLSQRGFDDLRISEQAIVLAMRHSKMFSEEKRQQIAEELEVMEGKSKSKLAKTGEEYGLSKDSVARLIRVNKLIPELKSWVDIKQLSIRAAVELSYIPEEGQKKIYNVVKGTPNGENPIVKICIKAAKALRAEYKNRSDVDNQEIINILFPIEEKHPKNLKLSSEIYSEYFNESDSEEYISNVIKTALKEYFHNSPVANRKEQL